MSSEFSTDTDVAGSSYWYEDKGVYIPFGLSAISREHNNLQMIDTLSYEMSLGTVKRTKVVTKPAVNYNTYANMDQTFRFQRHTGLA